MKTAFLLSTLILNLALIPASSAQAAPQSHTEKSHPANAIAAATATPAAAPLVQVQDAWVRATVPGQKVAAAYMQLQALQSDLKLQELRSPAAPLVQIHGMNMQGDVMHMFEIQDLSLPKGQTVTLHAGGTHIMLMDLPQALTAGSQIALELRFAGGKSQTLTIPVLAQAPAQPTPTKAMQPQPHHH